MIRLGEVACPKCGYHFDGSLDNLEKSSIGETFTCHACKTVFRKRYKKIPLYGFILSPLVIYGIIYLMGHVDGVGDNGFHLMWLWIFIFGIWTLLTSTYEIVDESTKSLKRGNVKCSSCRSVVGIGFLDMRFVCSGCGKAFNRRISGWASLLLSLGLMLMAVAVANGIGIEMWPIWMILWLAGVVWALQSATWQEVKNN